MKHNPVIIELKRIAKEHGGILRPETVVEEARPKSSPLHKRFTWDNNKAAHEYRIWQARQLIRVVVEPIAGAKGRHEVFVSLTSDRKDSGYRVMTEVLSDAQMRRQMLEDALRELDIFQLKYSRLRELSAVFAVIRKIRSKKNGRITAGMVRRVK